MNLYHISRIDNYNYEEYSDAVVVARNKLEASNIHPSGNNVKWYAEHKNWMSDNDTRLMEKGCLAGYSDWPEPDMVNAEFIGRAADHLERGTVICASFHAG